MVTLLVSLLVVAAFAAVVSRYAPRPGGRAGNLPDRYRPHAPMADWSLPQYDDQRQFADLAAVRAHTGSGEPQ